MTAVTITGGGTGGHLFPGLAVASVLRERGVELSWIGARRGLEASRVPATGIPVRLLAVTGAVGRSRPAQAVAAARLVPATGAAARWLLRHDASAVLSVGGYAALPASLAACSLGIPLVIQEQNSRPGLTNRLLAPWASTIACGFPSTPAAFPSLPAIFTGNPVRQEFFEVPDRHAPTQTVLVTGGSQGAAVLNRQVPEAFALAAREGLRPRIVHQSGPRWETEVRERYAAIGLPAEVVAFLEQPWLAFAEASLLVTRAGALTVSEIAAAGRFAVLVPFAAAAHGHQLANAQALAATGGAEIVEESNATPAALAAVLSRLLAEPYALAVRGARSRALAAPDAANAVANLVMRKAGVAATPEGGRDELREGPPPSLHRHRRRWHVRPRRASTQRRSRRLRVRPADLRGHRPPRGPRHRGGHRTRPRRTSAMRRWSWSPPPWPAITPKSRLPAPRGFR